MVKVEVEKGMSKEKKDLIIIGAGVGILFGAGYILGAKVQRDIVSKGLKNVVAFTKVANPAFPDSMSIAEIKEVLSTMEGAEFFDALAVCVDGVQSLIIR